MRKALALVMVLASLCIPMDAIGGKVELTPSAIERILKPGDGGNEIVLIRFPLPSKVLGSQVLQAILWMGTECIDEEGVAIWANPAPPSWDGDAVDWSWWTANSRSIEDREAVQFETADCTQGAVRLDVSRWVREWARGEWKNSGFVLRRPPVSSPSFKFTATEKCAEPTLRITYLARQPSDERP